MKIPNSEGCKITPIPAPIPAPPPIRFHIELDLSEDEAKQLWLITGNVAGDFKLRGSLSKIYQEVGDRLNLRYPTYAKVGWKIDRTFRIDPTTEAQTHIDD